MAKADLTAQYLRELLHYDPETGCASWRVSRGGVRAGLAAGNPSGGYLQLRVAGVTTSVHRIAWLYVYGVWPVGFIDHIDGNPRNNRIANLRDVNQSVNMQNEKRARANSRSGFLGVSAHRSRWRANISIEGKTVHIGTFDTPHAAHAAYLDVKRRQHAGCTI